MPRKDTSEELLRYTFTREEKQVLSDNLALACQNRYTAEEEKKSAMAGFKKRIDEEIANIAHLSRLVNSGWEMRGIICNIDYNVPEAGQKRYTRQDTGELVREVVMTANECQDTLKFEDPDAEAKLAEKLRLQALERSVRAFLSTAPEENVTIEPVDISEITSFSSGEFIIAAVDLDAAVAFAKSLSLPLPISLMYSDPDRLMFSGFEDLYGDDRRSARAAIMHLYELGRPFPAILAMPASVVAEVVSQDAAEDAVGEEGGEDVCGESMGQDDDGADIVCVLQWGHEGDHSPDPEDREEGVDGTDEEDVKVKDAPAPKKRGRKPKPPTA